MEEGGVMEMKMTNEDKRKQVADQCKVVAHLATALAQVHSDLERIFREGAAAELLDGIGANTAHRMEVLGDILNGMDAVTEDDEWTHPVFKKAHQLWPQKDQSNAGQ